MNVRVYDKNVNRAIAELKRKLRKEGVFSTLKDRAEGVSASGRRRIKEGRARGRLKRRLKGVRNTLDGLKV